MANIRQNKELTKRLKYIAGQVQAIVTMIHEGRSPQDIHAQLQSVQAAFRKSIMATFEDQHRKELAALVVRRQDECPGSCSYCDFIASVKHDFPNLEIGQVLELLHRIQTTTTTE